MLLLVTLNVDLTECGHQPGSLKISGARRCYLLPRIRRCALEAMAKAVTVLTVRNHKLFAEHAG